MLATTAPPLLDAPTAPSLVPALCRHCGDLCGPDVVRTDDGPFCCRGCASVFSLLDTHGLTAFYTCDVRPGLSQRAADARDAGRFAALDDPAIAGRLIEPGAGGSVRVTLAVPSLHCASCLWLLEQLWRFDPGIGRSEADLLRRTVRIEFDPAKTTLRAIAERLATLGYEPAIDGERTPSGMPVSRRTLYLKIGLAGFAVGNVMLFSIPRYANGAPLEPTFQRLFDVLNILFALPVLVYSASEFFSGAWASLRARAMTLDVPIALGLVVLFGRSVFDIATGRGEGFLDSFAGLVFLLLIGRLFQHKAFDSLAFDRTVRSFFPLSVRVEREGAALMTPLERLRPGDVIVVRAQEVVPADAVLLDAAASIDYAFVTGEAVPLAVRRGETVHAGGRIVDRAQRLSVLREVSHSRLAELWNNPVFAKTKHHRLTDVSAFFGRWFTIVAIALAALGAIAWWPDGEKAVQVATAVLIIACPCALTLAAPITLGTAMGRLGRAGCYLKHAAVALDLSRVDAVAFDKTGTLTTSTADAAVTCEGLDESAWARVRRLAAESVHPVSRALAGREAIAGSVDDVREIAGEGIAGRVEGQRVVIGTAGFVSRETGDPVPLVEGRTWAWVAGRGLGAFTLTTPERPGMSAAAGSLAASHETWLLSGDHALEAPRWAGIFGSRMRFRLGPDDKLAAVRDRQAAGRRVLMVGDGLNDAGALAAADVGLAVSDDTACLVPACDVVVRGDRLAALPGFLRYARRAQRVIVLCFVVSILYNAFGIGLALAGLLTPLVTAIFMPVSSLTIIGLSVGLMRGGTRGVLPE